MFQYLEPEVSGGLGEGTQLDSSVHPPLVKVLHYKFDGWLGDDIVTSFPCFLVTGRLRDKIENCHLTGVLFSDVMVNTSDLFEELHPDTILPKFYWMKVFGMAGKEDFGLAEDHRLVISSKAFNVLSQFNITKAEIEDYPPAAASL